MNAEPPSTDWRFEPLDLRLVADNGWGCDGVAAEGGLCPLVPTVVAYSAQLNMRARLCGVHHAAALRWLAERRA